MINKMKRILIVVPSFVIGGTIVSLNSMLSLIDTKKYEIDVFALNRKGEYLNRLPNCTILPENLWLSHSAHTFGVVKNTINKTLRVIRAICRRLNWSSEPLLCKLADKQVNFQQYDTVVNYAESVADVVCHYPVKKRVTWIHCDYKRYLTLVNNRNETKVYEKFDNIVCVSEFAKGTFVECIPQMESKTVAIHNVINAEDIKQKAKEVIDDEQFKTDNYTIVSAGRLDPVKQFHLIPQLTADIKKQTDKKFVWYIIGGDRGFESYVDKIRKDIIDLDVSNEVVMLGEKTNIYPYMAKADLYVSTSLSESFPLVINEAKALDIPIVSNNFGSAYESVEDGIDGFIVSIENRMMSKKILTIIEGKDKLQSRNNCNIIERNNLEIINYIDQIL